MVSVRSLLVVGLLISTISCSDKSESPTLKKARPEPTPQPTEAITAPQATPVIEEPTVAQPPEVKEKYLDPYTSVLIREVQHQVKSENSEADKQTLNVLFANRIFRINYIQSEYSPKLSLITHSAKAFDFVLTATKGNIQYFNAFGPKPHVFTTQNGDTLYSAEVRTISSQNKNISIIKIKEIDTGAIVHVFYVKKSGTVKAFYLRGYDYTNSLTKTSKIFLQRLIENNSVDGEFYGVITEQDNISNASRFNVVVSNNFILASQPLVSQFREGQPNSLPLIVDYKSFWKTLCGQKLCGGSTSYKVISEPSYVIESERNPVELTVLNIEFNIEAKEEIEGKKNSLPMKLFIQFK